MSRHALHRGSGSGPSTDRPPASEVVERILSEVATEDVGRFDDTGPVASGPPRPPRIPPGDYEATTVSATARTYRFGSKAGVRKCVLALRITGDPRIPQGEGVVVELIKPLHSGSSSDYRRAWVLATGRQPRRDDRLPMSVFRGHRFLVRVVDVMTDSRGIPLAPVNCYSRVAALLEKIA